MAKLGLQLYTIKDAVRSDFVGALRRVAEIGYEGVEFAGYHDMPADVLGRVLDETNLSAAATHILLADLESRFDREVETCKTLRCQTLICPFIPREDRADADGWHRVAERFNVVGERIHRKGLRFLYHHHGFDFEPIEHTRGFDILLEHTDPMYVGFELDCYWLEVAGIDSIGFYQSHADRVPSLHLKNMRSRIDHHDVELGEGAIDIAALVNAARGRNIEWLVVEQEQFDRDPMESVAINYRHLVAMVDRP